MKISLITNDEEMIEKVNKVIEKFEDVELKIFNSLDDFLNPFSNIYRLILIDYLLGEEEPITVIRRINQLNPDGWIIALSPNILRTYDLADAGAKITILRNSMDLLESVIEGIVNPKSPGEVEKKYGYVEEEDI